ncbi:DUF3040 domain-containing protein [Arthrobacter sp. NyZ413]|uniref:DUF3040 domain-containing protein n=1 Tax=Arthrobacter sp. NyZ413 TaxID=3144669 RepID=UPI003BF81BA8
MALTEHEQRQLRLLAEQLREDDPRLAAKLSSSTLRSGPRHGAVQGGFALLVGSMVLLAGIAARVPLLGIFGFTVMGTGAYLLSLGIRGRLSGAFREGSVTDENGPVASS